jgi:hypothetical protein
MSAETDEQKVAVSTGTAVLLSRYKRPLAPEQRQAIYLVGVAVRHTDITTMPKLKSLPV